MRSKDPDRESTRTRFDEVAAGYDSRFVRFIDKYDEMHAVTLSLVEQLGTGGGRVLDLGTGTGESSRHLLERFPEVRVHGVDFSTNMIAQARNKLARFSDRFTIQRADLADYIPPKTPPFDVILSALAIHHLRDDEKAVLMARCHEALGPNGFFINADLLKGESPREVDLIEGLHLEEMRARNLPEEEIQERIERHRRHDIPATLSDQVRWLKEAGFREVWVPWRHLYQVILVALG